jgi:MEMO1 family protein
MGSTRTPAVAGMFYPAEPSVLADDVQRLLHEARPSPQPTLPQRTLPKAIIAPHAGYIYSGPIAATAYARLAAGRDTIRRVVLIGPSHRVPFRGLAVSSAETFQTPLGAVPVDQAAREALLRVPGIVTLDAAHADEHSLEVHLPFLQSVLDHFTLVPLVAGDASAELVASALETVWGGRETVVVVSSDLSHYLDYAAAKTIDARTCTAIEGLDPAAIGYDQACGQVPIKGLLTVARRQGLTVETVDLRNSGDTAGPRHQVVGYGAWAFTETAVDKAADTEGMDEMAALQRHKATLLGIARSAIAGRCRGEQPTLPADVAEELRRPGACFVTLRRQGGLRGCIGSPEAWRPLAVDVTENAAKAAFEDPRFPPLAEQELADLDICVSVLTAPRPVTFCDESDLLRQLRPRIDGLIIEAWANRALFLPAVWEVLAEPAAFLGELKRKAGLPVDYWSAGLRAFTFTAVELKSD